MSDREAPNGVGDTSNDATVVRHEQELQVGRRIEQVGTITARKEVESHHVEHFVPRDVEAAEVERIAPSEADSGLIETLPDGSVSIPVLEEEIVITKRTVVRERIIIRKNTTTEQHKIEADLLVERVEVDTDDGALEQTADHPSRPGP